MTRALRFVATCDSFERIVYGRTETLARRRLPLVPAEGPPWSLRVAGHVERGVLHLPPEERARLVVDGRRAPGS